MGSRIGADAQSGSPIIKDAPVSDEPNKLADEMSGQPDSPAVAAEPAAPLVSGGVSDSVVADAAVSDSLAAGASAVEATTATEAVGGSAADTEVGGDAGAELSEHAGDGADSQEDEMVAETVAADQQEQQQDAADVEPVAEGGGVSDAAEGADPDDEIKMDWYILKVQSNREKSITAALRRKIAVEGLDQYFGDVVVPMEKVTEFKGGTKKIVERKLYPGYIVVHMHINDDTWFAVRETAGIGDFTGSGGKPTPMLPHEVARIIQTEEEIEEEAPKLNINFLLGDRVKVKEGTFESFEGEVSSIDEQSGRVTVMINIFGRSTPVELEYWQAEQM